MPSLPSYAQGPAPAPKQEFTRHGMPPASMPAAPFSAAHEQPVKRSPDAALQPHLTGGGKKVPEAELSACHAHDRGCAGEPAAQ